MSELKAPVKILQAIAEPIRLKIVTLLAVNKEGLHVNKIAEECGIPFVNVSHHLKVLEVADVIVKQKDARSVISTLNPEYWNPSNKGDTCGYLAFGGFKLALPAANSGETAPAKASKPPKKGKPSPPPKAEDEDEDDDEDDDEE